MSPSRFLASACCAAIVAALLTGPARAEGNRLLPFWGQPYPFGYAWTRTEPLPRNLDRCGARFDRTGHAHGRARRCDVVLHARD